MIIRIPKICETQYQEVLARLKADLMSKGEQGTDAECHACLIALADAATGGVGIVGVEPSRIVTADAAATDWVALANRVNDLSERIGAKLEEETKVAEGYNAWLKEINEPGK